MGGLQAQTLGSSGNSDARKLRNPVQPTPQSIAAGKELYSKNCRSCHGADAKGNGPMKPKDSQPSNLTDASWDRGGSDGEIYAVLRDGAGPNFIMRGYRSRMTDQDLWHLVNYIRSLNQKRTH
jgi:mono/diheme cytochrome c family protein